jgi:TatD DNase family protein
MLVDSHCHLDFPDFADELDDVVARAGDAGVARMVTICTRVREFPKILAVAERFDNIWCSVGLHPHSAAEEPELTVERLVELTANPKVVGIGETGLDYYYDKSPRDVQQAQFRKHIDAARRTGLPLIVHTRDADEDMAAILREEMAEGAFTGVLHCFTSSRWLADAAVELGLYISLSGIVTFRNAEDLRLTAQAMPPERLLVETDAPFLAPIPHRGKRNEPAFVADTAARVGELIGLSADDVAALTTENFHRLFARVPAAA